MNLYEYFVENKKTFIVNKDTLGRDLYSVKYAHLGIDWEAPHVLDARGLVINSQGDIIARPYKKFFGYNQLNFEGSFASENIQRMCEWEDEQSFIATDKLDGSLVIMSQYDGDLLCASSGSTYSFISELVFEYIEHNFSEEQVEKLLEITKEYTLLFEYMSEKNVVVIEYDKESLVLHGAIHTITGKEYTYEQLKELSEYLGIDLVRRLDLNSKGEIIKYIVTQKGIEGLVVWFENGKRLKFKTKEYVEKHTSVLSNKQPYTKRNIAEIFKMLQEDTLDDYMALKNIQVSKIQDRDLFHALQNATSIYKEILENIAEEINLAKEKFDVKDGELSTINKEDFQNTSTRELAIYVNTYNKYLERKDFKDTRGFYDFVFESEQVKNKIENKFTTVMKEYGAVWNYLLNKYINDT